MINDDNYNEQPLNFDAEEEEEGFIYPDIDNEEVTDLPPSFVSMDTFETSLSYVTMEDPLENTTNPLATLVRLADIPDYLTPDRRQIWYDNLVNYEINIRQRKTQRKDPLTHMKKLINFINDYLDKHNLADTKTNQILAKNAYYIGGQN